MRRQFLSVILLALGIGALISGLVIGLNSRQAIYKQQERGKLERYLSAHGNGYFRLSTNQKLYFLSEKDFSPAIQGINTFVKDDEVSFVYDINDSTQIDVQSERSRLKGTAYRVVQITSFVDQKNTTYTTAEYKQHPKGYYRNVWTKGGVVLVPGLLLSILGLILLLRKGTTQENSAPVQPAPQQPSPFPTHFQPISQQPISQPQYSPVGNSLPPTQPGWVSPPVSSGPQPVAQRPQTPQSPVLPPQPVNLASPQQQPAAMNDAPTQIDASFPLPQRNR